MYSVYLVDDDTLILEEMINIVPWMDNGFEVIGSNINPVQAVEEIVVLRPDVVFLDLKMPDMDGNELIKTLHERGVDDVEFIMISGYDNFNDVREFFRQSGFDYILKPVNSDDIQMTLEKIMGRLKETKPLADKPAKTGNAGFDSMLQYINENFASRITLDLLSNTFGYSKNYICGLFAKHLNTSLTYYLMEIRMKHAKELLRDESKMIKEVASECGYPEYYHFFRVFKAYYGVSPKEMQK